MQRKNVSILTVLADICVHYKLFNYGCLQVHEMCIYSMLAWRVSTRIHSKLWLLTSEM